MLNNKITLDHGSGGLATKKLIEEIFLKRLTNPILMNLEDSAVFNLPPGKVAFTTDSFVIDPIFFPGGNIGSLAVHGTVNDLAMQGAKPFFLSLGLILEEGLEIEILKQIAEAISYAAEKAEIQIVAADTKVVGKGQADKIFINTSGIGVIDPKIQLGINKAKAGDKIIVSGFIGDHGASILLARSGLSFNAEIKSDSAPLNRLVEEIITTIPTGTVRLLRDPTRGGLATVLNEIAEASNVEIEIDENEIPIRSEVIGVCELLGLDPLYLANEGKCVLVVEEEVAQEVLNIIKKNPLGKHAKIIGEVKLPKDKPRVFLRTKIGGVRIVPLLTGEPLPRIC